MMEPGGVSNKYTPAEANANTTSCLNDLAGCEQKKKKPTNNPSPPVWNRR